MKKILILVLSILCLTGQSIQGQEPIDTTPLYMYSSNYILIELHVLFIYKIRFCAYEDYSTLILFQFQAFQTIIRVTILSKKASIT